MQLGQGVFQMMPLGYCLLKGFRVYVGFRVQGAGFRV